MRENLHHGARVLLVLRRLRVTIKRIKEEPVSKKKDIFFLKVLD